MAKRNNKRKKQFSKVLLIQESVLIWITTLSFLVLAAVCIWRDYTGSLPWLTAMISFPWAAYGVSQCFYYNKSKNENTKNGIKYETVMADLLNSSNQNSNDDIDIDYGV